MFDTRLKNSERQLAIHRQSLPKRLASPLQQWACGRAVAAAPIMIC